MQSVIKVAGIALLFLGLAHTAEAQTGPWSAQGASNCSDQYGSFDAFIPGMRGKGACNRGGFVPGTNVIVVTNRNASGSGSFASAVQASCPKVILFGVAGNIANNGLLQIATCDNWSIVGSSAPGNITLSGSGPGQMMLHGNNFTVGHMTIPSGSGDDAVTLGGFSQGQHNNGLIYNSTMLFAPVSSALQCYSPVGQEQTNMTFWQNMIGVSVSGAIGVHLMQNTCSSLDTIRSFYFDSQARVPLVRSDGYFHANNVHVNMANDFSRSQPCDGGIYGSPRNSTRHSFVNNAYSEGPASGTAGGSGYIRLWDSQGCTTFQMWEQGTVAMANPGQSMRNCTNHGCTSGYGGAMQGSAISSIHPTGYVPETISSTQQGLIDFATQVGTYVGARPTDRFTYIQNKIDYSINAIDGTGTTSSWGPSNTVASEGGLSVVQDTPVSGYDPTNGAQNPCGEDMPSGAAANAIQSSGLTRLHEWAIGCFMDSVMPAGYREDKLQNYAAPGGGGSGPPPPPPPPRPNPPEWGVG